LVLTAGLSLEPLEDASRGLLRVLAVVSGAVWLVAAALGRGFCRRALGPVARMAEAARGMGAAELERTLPDLNTGDELQDLSEAFNGLLARLREAFERQQRFTGDASHQLRTPLAAMLGQVDVALRRERTADDYRRTLTSVRDQAEHMGRIVEALLFLARADVEAELPGLEEIDLAHWVDDHLRNRTPHPRVGDLLVVDATADPLRVRVHPPLLAQLFDNVLDNACKYSAPGTPIAVRIAREPSGAVLSVEDRGTGIAEEDLPRIFEPFYRSSRARREGRTGVGLGLAVAQRIAQAFGGSLSAKSVVGDGSRFTLILPIHTVGAAILQNDVAAV
jgi:signal transduction histidine kinase